MRVEELVKRMTRLVWLWLVGKVLVGDVCVMVSRHGVYRLSALLITAECFRYRPRRGL